MMKFPPYVFYFSCFYFYCKQPYLWILWGLQILGSWIQNIFVHNIFIHFIYLEIKYVNAFAWTGRGVGGGATRGQRSSPSEDDCGGTVQGEVSAGTWWWTQNGDITCLHPDGAFLAPTLSLYFRAQMDSLHSFWLVIVGKEKVSRTNCTVPRRIMSAIAGRTSGSSLCDIVYK